MFQIFGAQKEKVLKKVVVVTVGTCKSRRSEERREQAGF